MSEFESLGQFHDYFGWLLLSAPENFRSYNDEPINQDAELKKAFSTIRSNFHLTKKNIKDERLYLIAKELLEMSFEAYLSGDAKKGAHSLQECEGLVWKSRALRPKHAVEAELRVFGQNITYAGVHVSLYPYEGSHKDLGTDQAVLLELAKKHVEHYLSKWMDFSFFAWVIEADGSIKRISPDPKEDDGSVLKPIQRSFSACCRRARELAEAGKIRACVIMNIIGPQGDGLVCYELEQQDHPRISARQLFKLQKGPSHIFEPMRYHLEEPNFFSVRS
jgi:hypothetical protein